MAQKPKDSDKTAKKSKTKKESTKSAKKAKKDAAVVDESRLTTKRYFCTCCGKSWQSPRNHFNHSNSPLYAGNDGYINICVECRDRFYESVLRLHNFSDELALLRMCQLFDWYYSQGALNMSKQVESDVNRLGHYLAKLNLEQNSPTGATYMDNLKEDFEKILYKEPEVKIELEKIANGESAEQIEDIAISNGSEKDNIQPASLNWSKEDIQNKNYSISTVGYDPFEGCNLTEKDRRYCFNILAGYCDTEGIQEDGHKIQSVIRITLSQLQCTKIDEMINDEFLKLNPDEQKVQKLTSTKKALLDSIAKIAQDNNLSSAYNKNSKQNSNTLSSKMKEMSRNNYEAIKVNLFDIKTAAAMKQIADLSNQSILEQISLDNNDYVNIVKDQREMITQLETEHDALKEENRLLKNKILTLENQQSKVGE